MKHTLEYIIHNILYITNAFLCYTDVAEEKKKKHKLKCNTAILFLSIADYGSNLLQVNATAAGISVKAPYYTTLKSFSSLAAQGPCHARSSCERGPNGPV